MKVNLAVLVVLGMTIIAVIIWQQDQAQRQQRTTGALRAVTRQLDDLRTENAQLRANLAKVTASADAERGELLRLRSLAGKFHHAEQENAHWKAERARLASQALQDKAAKEAKPSGIQGPERTQLAAKTTFVKHLGLALLLAAQDNNGVVPAQMPRALVDLLETITPASEQEITARQFELGYTGSLDALKDPNSVVLAREKEPVQLSDGQWVKVYVFADGHSESLAAATPAELAMREKVLWPDPPR